MKDVKRYMADILGDENVFLNEPMKKHTSFKAGGVAALLVTPDGKDKLIEAVRLLREEKVPFFVMGNGTNLLVRDAGFNGVIIKICGKLSRVDVGGCVLTAEAGALLSSVSKIAYDNSLSGLEFAEGIPGTVGGAAAMNAGAYGGEIKGVIKSAEVIDCDGKVLTFDNPGLELGYRSSVLGRRGFICLSAVFGLSPGDKKLIKEKMEQNRNSRVQKQPLDKPSAGSTFKRPEGYFAGKLIADSGLGGCKVGGASVSRKHCGFVINDGNATASDITGLIDHVRETVFKRYGVMLETEVKIIGG